MYTIYSTALYYNNGVVNKGVEVKAGLDLVMTGVGFLGPIGFGISTAYYLLGNATGGFGLLDE